MWAERNEVCAGDCVSLPGLLPVPARKGRAADSRVDTSRPSIPAGAGRPCMRSRQLIQKPDLDRQVARVTARTTEQIAVDKVVTEVGSALSRFLALLRDPSVKPDRGGHQGRFLPVRLWYVEAALAAKAASCRGHEG